MSEPLRVGVLASGRGSNFRALAEAAAGGRIPAAVVVAAADAAAATQRLEAAGERVYAIGEIVPGAPGVDYA